MLLIYVLETNDITNAVKTAMEIYSTTGMQPAVITDGVDKYKFDCKDASLLSSGVLAGMDYAVKHEIK